MSGRLSFLLIFTVVLILLTGSSVWAQQAGEDSIYLHPQTRMEQMLDEYLEQTSLPTPGVMMCGLGLQGVYDDFMDVLEPASLDDLLLLSDHPIHWVRGAAHALIMEKAVANPDLIQRMYNDGNARIRFKLYIYTVDAPDQSKLEELLEAMIDDPATPVYTWDLNDVLLNIYDPEDLIPEISDEYENRLMVRVLMESPWSNEKITAARRLQWDHNYPAESVSALVSVLEADENSFALVDYNRGYQSANDWSSVKYQCAYALGAYGQEAYDGVPNLLSVLNYPDSDVRIAAMSSLYQIGYEPETMLSGLLEILHTGMQDYYLGTLVEHFRIIGTDASEAAPDLCNALSEHVDNRRIAWALTAVTGSEEKAFEVYLSRMDDPDPEVREGIIRDVFYECIHVPGFIETIYGVLEDETDPSVKVEILNQLDYKDEPVNRLMPYMIDLLDTEARWAILYDIKGFGTEAEKAIPVILSLYDDLEITSYHWREISDTVVAIGGSEKMVLDKLLQVMEDREDVEEKVISYVIDHPEHSESAFSTLIELANERGPSETDYYLKKAMQEILMLFDARDTDRVDELISVMNPQDDQFTSKVIDKVVEITGSYDKVIDKLVEWVRTDDRFIQFQGVRKIRQLGINAVDALPDLRDVLENGPHWNDTNIEYGIAELESLMEEPGET